MSQIMDRMKNYEKAYNFVLPPRIPIILRLDGRSFHNYCKSCQKPFDLEFMDAMDKCAVALCKDIQGAQMAYVQSDEISILIHYYKKFDSQSWFANEIQKITSVSAAIAASVMTAESLQLFGEIRLAQFDARVFVIPENDVCNYFLARQKDWERNSIQMLARSLYSHKECYKKNNSQLQEMCFQKEKRWDELSVPLKRGRCIVKCYHSVNNIERTDWVVDNCIPIFSQDRNYIEKYLETEE